MRQMSPPAENAMRQTFPVRKSKSRPSSSRGGDVIPQTTSMAVLPPDSLIGLDRPVSRGSVLSASSSRPSSRASRGGLTVIPPDAVTAQGLEEFGRSTFMTNQFENEDAARREEEEQARRLEEAAAKKAAEEKAAKTAAAVAAKKKAEEAAVAKKAAEEAAAKKAAEEAAAKAAEEAALKAAEEAARVAAEEEAAKAKQAEEEARRALEEQLAEAERAAKEAEEEERRVAEARTAAALEVKRYETARQTALEEAEAKRQKEVEAKQAEEADAAEAWRREVQETAAAAAAAAEQEQGAAAEQSEPIKWSDDLGEYVAEEEEEETDGPAKSYEEIAVSVDAFLAMQDAMREHLQQYCHSLANQRDDEGNKLVDFPENFEDVVDVMQDEARQATNGGSSLQNSKWSKYLMDEEVANPKGKNSKPGSEIDRQKKLMAGMRAIQKLDMKLKEKTREAAELKKQREGLYDPHEDGSSERDRQLARVEVSVKEELRSNNWIGGKKYELTEAEKLRVEQLMDGALEELEGENFEEMVTGWNGYAMDYEDSARLADIDKALSTMELMDRDLAAPSTTHFDGSAVYNYLDNRVPKSGDAGFLQFEAEQRELRKKSLDIERSLHKLSAAPKWPRPDDVDRDAVAKVLDEAKEQVTSTEQERLQGLLEELRAEGIAGGMSSSEGTTIPLKCEGAEGPSTSPTASPPVSPPPFASKVRAVKLNKRHLVVVNPVLANSPEQHTLIDVDVNDPNI